MAESTSDRISYLNGVATDALNKMNTFFNSINYSYASNTMKTPTSNPILTDPTMKTLTKPSHPDYPSPLNEAFPTIYTLPNGEKFSEILASPPVFQSASNFGFSEGKEIWLSNETKEAIRKLFNETGYEAVEIDLWEKGIEKDKQALDDAEDAIISSVAARGFTMPNDIMDMALNDLNNKFDDSRLQRNSDITFKQMDIAQKNVQAGIGFGLQGEELFMGYSSRMAGRALDAAKAMAGLGLEIFRTKTLAYNAELKANREKMQGTVEIETGLLDVYNEQSNVIKSQLDAYTSSISTLLSGFNNMLSAYKAEIRAGKVITGVKTSWQKAKYRENLVNIKATLETNILNLNSWLAVEDVNMHRKASSALSYVHYLAAALGDLQVLITEATVANQNLFEA